MEGTKGTDARQNACSAAKLKVRAPYFTPAACQRDATFHQRCLLEALFPSFGQERLFKARHGYKEYLEIFAVGHAACIAGSFSRRDRDFVILRVLQTRRISKSSRTRPVAS